MSAAEAGFSHSALFYHDRGELLEGVGPFAAAASALDEALLVAMPSRSLEIVADVIDPDAPLVSFMDLDDLGRNPARVMSAWREFAQGEAGGANGTRVISECLWFGRDAAEIEECERHEQMLNKSFGGDLERGVLCTYDRRLADDVIDRVGCSHRELVQDGDPALPSDDFVEPADSDPLGGILGTADKEAEEMSFGRSELADLRAFVRRGAQAAGLERVRQEDLVLAADELATNSILHAGGSGTLRIWPSDGQVLCEVRDDGHISDPMVGRERPSPDQVGGRGLWLANQLCDLVQVRSGRDGSVVRLAMRTG